MPLGRPHREVALCLDSTVHALWLRASTQGICTDERLKPCSAHRIKSVRVGRALLSRLQLLNALEACGFPRQSRSMLQNTSRGEQSSQRATGSTNYPAVSPAMAMKAEHVLFLCALWAACALQPGIVNSGGSGSVPKETREVVSFQVH